MLRDGSLIEAVRASISIPGIFTPVAIKGRYLVDGGLINAVPVSVCREMGADYVIGVNVVPEPSKVLCNPNKNQQYSVSSEPNSKTRRDRFKLWYPEYIVTLCGHVLMTLKTPLKCSSYLIVQKERGKYWDRHLRRRQTKSVDRELNRRD